MDDSVKILTKAFYSNCLIEAVKAKLKNWKNVEIKKIPSYINVTRNPHYYWVHKDSGRIFEFVEYEPELPLLPDGTIDPNSPESKKYLKSKKSLFAHTFFKGNIIETSHKKHVRLLDVCLGNFISELERYHDIKSRFSRNIYNWMKYDSDWDYNIGLNFDEPAYMMGLYKENDVFKIGIYYLDKQGQLINPNNDPVEYVKYCNVEIPGVPPRYNLYSAYF